MVDFHLGRFRRDHSDVDLALWKRDGDRLAPNLAARGARFSLGYERWPLPGAFGVCAACWAGRLAGTTSSRSGRSLLSP